jgi:hypothetical protein
MKHYEKTSVAANDLIACNPCGPTPRMRHRASALRGAVGDFTKLMRVLAALANDFYGLSLHRMKITLRYSQNGRSPLRDALATRGSPAASYLTRADVIDLIESFYPIRDVLQHREFPFTVGRSTGRGRNLPSAAVLPREGIERLARGLGENNPSLSLSLGNPDEVMVELSWLVEATLQALEFVVNGVLAEIPWRSRAGDGVVQGDEYWARFSEGVGTFLGWGAEPLLFAY